MSKDELLDFNDLKFFEIINLSFDRFIIPSLERVFSYKLSYFYNKYVKAKYHLENKQSFKQFEKFTKSINKSNTSEKIVLNFGHWFFTKPIFLNKNCQFIDNLPQEVSQMIGVGKCSIKLLKNFINILKDRGIYKNSIIIFKSDNGLFSSFYSKSEALSLSKNNSNFGYSIYRPFLMVKSFEPIRSNSINESIISTFDLANYYCNELNKFITNQSDEDKCKSLGNEDLYNALYFNKTTSNKKIDVLLDDGTNTHLMNKSIFKRINIIDGNIYKAFLKVFSD